MTQQEENALFDQFYAEVIGKYVEKVDSNALNQCVDEAIAWAMKLGFPINIYAGVTRAEQIYKTWSNPQFERIANTATFVPIKGDVCVWDGSLNGGIGHVSTATGEGDTNYFYSIDQNWILGAPCTRVKHNYDHFLGVQRLKVTQGTTPQPPTPPMNDLQVKKSVQVDKIASWFKDQGYATDSGTEQYFNNSADPDKFFNKVKAVIASVNHPVDTAAIKEEGRKQGVQQVKDVVSKLS